MYSYIFFALFVVGIFSIFENLKGQQKVSFFKFNLQILLFFVCTGSFLFFLDEIGFNVDYYIIASRVLGTIAMVNITYILASNKIPKFVILIETLFILFFAFIVFKGFRFASVKNGVFSSGEWDIPQRINVFIINGLILSSMFYNLIRINKKVDKNNLYHIKIRNWTFYLFGLIFSSIFIGVSSFILYNFHLFNLKPDTRFLFSTIYLILLLFVLYRPRFIDEADFSYSFKKLPTAQSSIGATDFEFLFYTNHYYLQPQASLEDFALKLNHSKAEILEYLQSKTNDSFNELLNKNRVKYFKELLKSKKQDSFTIEALSEMSGFNNRQSMYNAFKKYEGCAPSDYISTL